MSPAQIGRALAVAAVLAGGCAPAGPDGRGAPPARGRECAVWTVRTNGPAIAIHQPPQCLLQFPEGLAVGSTALAEDEAALPGRKRARQDAAFALKPPPLGSPPAPGRRGGDAGAEPFEALSRSAADERWERGWGWLAEDLAQSAGPAAPAGAAADRGAAQRRLRWFEAAVGLEEGEGGIERGGLAP